MIKQSDIISLFLQPERVLEFTPAQLSKVIVVLRQQKILARMCCRIQQAGVFEQLDEQSQRHFLNAKHIADRQREQVLNEAQDLVKTLDLVAEYLIFLKGAAYSMCGGVVGEGRIYSDIDILVPQKDIKACEKRLIINGWYGDEISDYDDKYYRKWAHEIPPMTHGRRGTIIDIHHNIVPLISKSSLNVDLLLEHKEEIAPGIYVLSASAQLVHAAIHLFRNEDYIGSFRDLTDLYLMLESQDFEFYLQSIALAKQVGFLPELKLAIRYVHRLLGLDVPCEASKQLYQQDNIKQWANDAIFTKVLLPQHSLMKGTSTPILHGLAAIRGHILKMPLHILIYHLSVKASRAILESIFGAHIFTPTDPSRPTPKQKQDI
jgi:hypothetical protein